MIGALVIAKGPPALLLSLTRLHYTTMAEREALLRPPFIGFYALTNTIINTNTDKGGSTILHVIHNCQTTAPRVSAL